jgi:DNA repair protein RadC
MPKSTIQENAIIEQAIAILLRRAQRGETLSSPDACRDYWRVALTGKDYEVFCVAFLDSQHRVITLAELFRGTLAQASVYPREVVKAALQHNAGAVIFAHNHPSGVAEPSRADEMLTAALKQALALVDIRVLDHFIIAGTKCMSFAERGLL